LLAGRRLAVKTAPEWPAATKSTYADSPEAQAMRLGQRIQRMDRLASGFQPRLATD